MVLALCFYAASASSLAESTAYHKISRIKIDGGNGYIYFQAEGGSWEAPSCNAGAYAYVVPSENTSADRILSVALAAKMAGKRVLFDGGCDASTYFKATNLWLE